MNRKALTDCITDGFTHRLRDPLWQDIQIDDGLKNIIETKSVQNLAGIKQNGPTYLIYPGSMHTRLSHSLGVYHTGRAILLSMLQKDECPFSKEGERSFLVSCILHDIGHFPYAHSLKEISPKTHEELASEIIGSDKELKKAIKDAGADPKRVAAIIDESLPSDEETDIYRNILSGTLDPDKLDYLNRDAFFAGVPYGVQDNSYIIAGMHLVSGHVAIEKSAYASIEHLLFSKYLMYKNVYWHKSVRSATAMIKKAVLGAIRDNVIKIDSLYFIDDATFNRFPSLYKYQPFSLIEDVRRGKLLKARYVKEFEVDGILEKEAWDVSSRFIAEDRVYRALKAKYTDLKPYEVVIDIPEPISFEADIDILSKDGKTEKFPSVTKLFTKDVVERFSSSLRNYTLFLPSYVASSDAEASLYGN